MWQQIEKVSQRCEGQTWQQTWHRPTKHDKIWHDQKSKSVKSVMDFDDLRWALLSHPTPPHPHPTSNWSWKSSACVCRTARKMMRLLCLCVHRNMNERWSGCASEWHFALGCASEWGCTSEWNFACASEGLAGWSWMVSCTNNSGCVLLMKVSNGCGW